MTVRINFGSGAGAAPTPTWADYATRWDAEPTFNSAIAAGAVWSYTLGGVTRYRLVPAPYDAAYDTFYITFSAGVMSGPIATRAGV